MRKSIVILITLTMVVLFSLSGCKKAVCGNGIVEEGETAQTCCSDAGCLGEQNCQNNKCLEPVCKECEYLQNHQCLNYRCCADEECIGQQKCVNHECVEPQCGECQYLENHQCLNYACCNDIGCDDNNINTEDKCVNPKTKQSKCEFEVKGCSDGTEYGQCSNTKPKYCTNEGALIEKCSLCGCPSNQHCINTPDYEPQIPEGSCSDVACRSDDECFSSNMVDGVIQIKRGKCINAGMPNSYCSY